MIVRPLQDWWADADRELLVNVPGRGRVALEIALLVALVLGGHAEALSISLAVAIVALETVLALWLLRPWAHDRRSPGMRAFGVAVALLAVTAPLLAHSPAGTTRRLGVELVPASSGGAAAGSAAPHAAIFAEVKSVTAGTPADGLLRTADHIEAVDGVPLATSDPPDELARRIQDDALPENFALTLRRAGALQQVTVHVPRVTHLASRLGSFSTLANEHVIVATALRDLLFIVLLILLTRVDRQPLSVLGLETSGAIRELAFAVPAIGGVFFVQVAAAVPLALAGSLLRFGNHEAVERMDTLSRISGQTSAPEFLVSLIVAAAFEEVAFRAFLTPRVRSLTGSWPIAAVLVSVVFGLGHMYEGTVAIAQTAILGLYFTAVFLARRRLLAVVTCHAAFNAIMFVLVQVIVRSGVIDRLKDLTPH